MTVRKVEIREMPNPEYIDVDFNFELKCDGSGPHFTRPIRKSGEYWDKLPDDTKKVVEVVMAVDGVFRITVYAYRLVIEKGRLFDFDAMVEDLTDAMRVLFGEDVQVSTSSLSS